MQPSQDILNSWKEISQYMNRGVRTVQRWERELGLPVRRPRGKGRSAVIALRSDLDHWIQSCPVEERQVQTREHLWKTRGEDSRFLLAAVDFGLTLADLALYSPHKELEKLTKTVTRACNAYETVLKFRDRITLDEPVRVKLDTRLQELKTALQGMGQTV